MAAKFGEVVVDLGYVTEAQLQEAIELQKKGRARMGEVMMHLRILTPGQVDDVLECQKNADGAKLFGECAVEKGLISQDQRDEAVKYQTTSKGMLGEILVEMGYLTREQREEAVRQQGFM
ncbi:hypothetical protein GF324_12575 [bacterium]|nr:hypothetical protein [bacterium]